ncbi:hypothetical protein EVG20_g7414 [Dentipellis fragilis]|uniref:DUF7702 domain-containing protein n=1 Tax=Dentipellis fragilis TaxID=205917 RepID=A0A4Y9YD31_9AGAM|nr:hypothetical protein EVG20_g7414 [Dentipellis fragilis]
MPNCEDITVASKVPSYRHQALPLNVVGCCLLRLLLVVKYKDAAVCGQYVFLTQAPPNRPASDTEFFSTPTRADSTSILFHSLLLAMSSSFENSTSLLTGGMPTKSQDIAPSVVFIALYTATSIFAAIRLMQYVGTPFFRTYIRIMVFELVRLATFIVRIIAAVNYSNALDGKGSFKDSYIIAEQIFLGIGFVIPTSTIVRLVEAHSNRDDAETSQKRILFRVMDLVLLAAVILGIVAGTSFSSALTNASDRHTVKIERRVNSVVSAVATMLVLILLVAYSLYISANPRLPRSTTTWIGITAIVLLVVPIYRIAVISHPPSNSQTTGNKIAFYVLQISFEWVVGLSLVAFNAISMCGLGARTDYSTSEGMSGAETYGLYAPKPQYQ